MKGTTRLRNGWFLTNESRPAIPHYPDLDYGSTPAEDRYEGEFRRMSRDQRYRGMIHLYDNDGDYWGTINAKRIRAALDQITLEDESAVVHIPFSNYDGYTPHGPYPTWHGKPAYGLTFRIGNGGSRIRVTAPCGETRVLAVSTLDRALSELGA